MLFSGCNIKKDEQPPIEVSQDETENQEDIENQQTEKEEQYYTSYNATLEYVPETSTIKAIEKITYKNTTGKKLSELYMNVYANAFTEESGYSPYLENEEVSVFPNGKEYMNFNITSLTVGGKEVPYSINGTSLCIQLSEALYNDAETEITLQFDVVIPNMHHETGKNDNILWAGNILPVMAVYDNYGWNKSLYYPIGESHYNDVGNYNIVIKTPEQYNVVATGIENSTALDGIRTTVIEAKLVRDFAFAISDSLVSKSVKTDETGVRINLYYYTYDEAKAEEIINYANSIMEYYVKNVGSYPYNHIDIVEASLYNKGDMQFSGVSFIDESWFAEGSLISNFDLNLGYQWFDCVVGTDCVKEPWLRECFEGFLQYMMNYTESELDTVMESEYNLLKKDIEGFQYTELSNPLIKYTTKLQFDNIQKRKSTMMMYALYKEMGAEKFSEFVKSYVTEYSFKNITSNEFFRTAEKVYGKSLYDFFNEWVNGTKIPKLTFEKETTTEKTETQETTKE